MAGSGGQSRASSAVMERSSNRPASEPPRGFMEGSGCCERAPRPAPLMIAADLKVGARDHARPVIPLHPLPVPPRPPNHLQPTRPLMLSLHDHLLTWCPV